VSPTRTADVATDEVPARAMLVRSLAAAVIVVLVVLGSLLATDDVWPFSPFRMFSAAVKVNGVVTGTSFVGKTTDGRSLRLDALDFGLRRAEVEGNLVHERMDERHLAALAAVWNERHPHQRLVRLEQHQVGEDLRDGRPVRSVDRTVTVWEAP
jgi:hypothetical protein